LKGAIGVENLNAVIFAVCHQHAILFLDHDGVRRVEFSGRTSTLAPLLDEDALLVELHDARITVAVGDENVPFGATVESVGPLKRITLRRLAVNDWKI
jgi:hypothetical protein